MREIKLRAWDKEESRMLYVIAVSWATNDVICADETDPCEDIVLDINRVELLQFTGLKDKSGREIYEGDVVAVSRCDSFSSFNRAIIVYADNYGAFLLQYVKKARKNGILAQHSIASIDGETIFGYCTGWEIEVIGNIYQDSHLLDN